MRGGRRGSRGCKHGSEDWMTCLYCKKESLVQKLLWANENAAKVLKSLAEIDRVLAAYESLETK